MGILRRADKSFRADYGLNPTNDDGYIVDLLCAESDNFQTMKVDADVEATQMPGVQWLLSSPPLDAVAIAEDGYPVRIVVPDPRTFALHKLWVSKRADRQTIKRPRDATHAAVVSELARQYLQQPLVAKDMPWLPKDLKALVKELKSSKVK